MPDRCGDHVVATSVAAAPYTLREEYAELFHSPGHALPSLAAFLGLARQGRLARFADRCHEEHAAALAQ